MAEATEIPQSDRDGAKGWTVALVAMSCLIVGPSSLLVSSFGVLLEPLSVRYGWSRGEVGLAVTFMAAGIMLCSVLQGALIDRFGSRRVVLTSIPCFSVALAGLCLLPSSLPLFYATWFALPFASVGLWPASYLRVVSGWFDRKLGLATGVANAGIAVSVVLIPPSLAAIAARGGLNASYLTMAALALVAFPIALLGLRELPIQHLPFAPGQQQSLAFSRIVKDTSYRRIAGCFLLLGLTGTGLVANLVPILQSKGLSTGQALNGLAIFGVMNLLGRLFTGYLLDQMHVSRVYWLLMISTIVSLIVLVLPAPALAKIAAVGALGLLAGGEFDILAFSLRRYFGLANFGRMYGLAFSLFQLGAGIGAALLALSVDRLKHYDFGLIVLAVSAFASALLLSRLGPYPSVAGEIDAGR